MPRQGESVWNLLSKGIITAEGTPGPHFGLAKQYQGVLQAPSKFALRQLRRSLHDAAAAQYRWNPFRRER